MTEKERERERERRGRWGFGKKTERAREHGKTGTWKVRGEKIHDATRDSEGTKGVPA